MKSKKSQTKRASIIRIATMSLFVALLVSLGSGTYILFNSGISLKDTIRNSIEQRQQYIDEITSPNVNYESHKLETQDTGLPE